MSDTLVVQLTNEHLDRIHNSTPVNGLAELIWNTVDSDATSVRVEYERDLQGGVTKVIVIDDGHGICFEELEYTFGKLGNSHKLTDGKTPKGRLYHGKTGQGRYKAFVLGRKITWETCYQDKLSNKFFTFKLIWYSHELTKIEVSEKSISNNSETGTKVIIENLYDDKIGSLDDAQIVSEKISVIMAPYLFAYKGINIGIEGFRVDPANFVKISSDFSLNIPNENGCQKEFDVIIKIIEWANGKGKNIYLCNLTGVTYDEEPLLLKKANFSVYVMSDMIEQMHINNALLLRDVDPCFKELIKKVHAVIKKYQREKLAGEALKTVQKLKEDNVYPYEGKPINKVEEVERQVFDICAVKVHEFLPDFTKNSKPSKKLTLQLLKQAIVQNPSSLKRILKDVLDLTIEQQDELADLLDKTSLNAIINTTKIITDRLAFINGLEQILYDHDFEKRLKERSQLHKILLGELWVFGDQYEYGCDDISLKNVLKNHLEKNLGRNELAEDVDIRQIKGLDDIPDLCLWRQYNFGKPDVYENLVVELKRPKCLISDKEINQIKRYAYAVEGEKYFDKEKTSWTFILLGTKLNNYARSECEQDDREFGHIVNKKNLNVYIKEWNQIIQEAKGKLNFIKNKLEYSVNDNSEGLSYLAKKYKEFLPE